VLLSLSLLFLATRIFFQYRRSRRFRLSDYLAVASWIIALCFVITEILTYYQGAFFSYDSFSATPATLKVLYAQLFFFDNGLYFAKASLIAFFFSPTRLPSRRLRFTTYFIAFYTGIAWVCVNLVAVLYCLPVSSNWSTNSNACIVSYQWLPYNLNYGLNVSSDLIFFLLPLAITREIKLSRQELWELLATLGLGVITILVSISRFVTTHIVVEASTEYYILCTTEQAISIIIICLPVLKPMIHRQKKHKQQSISVHTAILDDAVTEKEDVEH